MLWKTSLAVICMASVASSTFLNFMPKCWRKCAREAGVMCQWTDIPCLCKTANNGLHAKANTCACQNCGEHELGEDDHVKNTLKEFSIACKVTLNPPDQSVFDATYSAATCPGTDAPPSPPPSSPENGYGPAEPPSSPSPPAPAPAPASGYGYGTPPPPGPVPPPPQGSQAPSPSLSPYTSVTVPSSLFKPSSVVAPSSSSSAGYGYGIGSGAYDSTQVIQSTVVVIPVPVSQNSTSGGHTVTHTGTGTATVTGSKGTATRSKTGTNTGAQVTQLTGAAIRRDISGSIFALAAALAYGIA